VAVNCAAIPETLLEAELFGYERGAFTDARQAKAGLFQTAHGGTLFLDEIGLLPENLQAKLLTALEDRAVRRLGSTRAEPVDVWIISATSEDLKAGARHRGFREELYHRLAVVTLRLPALRERGHDIHTLAEHFLTRICAEYGQAAKTLTEDARVALLAYHWPGNVRELANVIERAVLLVDGPLVRAESLGLAMPRTRRASPTVDEEKTPTDGPVSMSLGQTVEEIERQHILEALHETRWNISRAANRLGVARNVLRYRVQKYGLFASSMAAPNREDDDARGAGDAAPGRGPARVQWERRYVAWLRADLLPAAPATDVAATGFTLDATVAKIESFGGDVEELSPSGVVAVFGLEPVEDAPRRAAHAALALEKLRVEAHGDSTNSPDIRIGLHVADALVVRFGSAARVEHAAKREAYQQLERLLGRAESGTVLVSEATRPFLERRFVLTPCAVEGTASEGVCRLVGLERTGLGLGARLTPFVARSHELTQLGQTLGLSQTGHGQVVAVMGEPGVGKSRFLWEFIEFHRRRASLILVSSAVSYGTQTPYLAVIDLLKAYFQVESRDDADRVQKKVTDKVLSLEAALAPALSALLALLDVRPDDVQWRDLDPQQKRRQTVQAVKLLLLEQSRRQPMILVFEDLHWVDSETQTVLDTLVESMANHRVLLLVSYRPQYQHPWAGKSYYAQLRLDPLSPGDAHALLDGLMGREVGPPTLRDMLVERTGGNPFFLEESVRTLIEVGLLGCESGDDRVVLSAGEIVPATVHAVLAARIDRLAPEDRELLQTAAVIGQDVPFALLCAVSHLPEDSIRASLARLQRIEFLYETRLVPESAYAFKHALTQDVAYAGLLPDRRRVLHARIMEAIEQLYASRLTEQVDRLAQHALRGEVWDKAVAYGRQAGEKAANLSAYRAAVACFEQALAALTHLGENREAIEQGVDLRVALRSALFALGEHQRGFGHLRDAQSLAERIGDQGRLGWISVYTAAHFWIAGDPARAVDPGQRALDVAQERGDLRLKVVATMRLGQVYLSLGDFERARECFQSNIDLLNGDLIYERFGEGILPSVFTRIWLVHVLVERGEFSEAIVRGEEALRIAEAVKNPFSILVAYRGLGYLYLRKGDLDEAIRCLERSRELGETWDIRAYVPGIIGYLGYAQVLSGHLTEGLSLLERWSTRQGLIADASGTAWGLATLGEAYALVNREDDALRAIGVGPPRSRRDHLAPRPAGCR
jgi:tetratricopeptide (TPR) repeat protein